MMPASTTSRFMGSFPSSFAQPVRAGTVTAFAAPITSWVNPGVRRMPSIHGLYRASSAAHDGYHVSQKCCDAKRLKRRPGRSVDGGKGQSAGGVDVHCVGPETTPTLMVWPRLPEGPTT